MLSNAFSCLIRLRKFIEKNGKALDNYNNRALQMLTRGMKSEPFIQRNEEKTL